MAAVDLKGVVKSYDGKTNVIHGIDLHVKHGEFVVFVGPSGCGKSTLLRMIAGLETITDGEIRIDGKVVNDLPPRARDIAMVFQDYALYPHKNLYDNMAFGLRLRKTPEDEIKQRVMDAARLLKIEHMLERRPAALSGGQRQRVAIGRAIVRQPKVFLFDEPLSNLDAQLRHEMRSEIKRLHQRLGATIIYVTHDQVEAMTMADRIVVMHDGIIEQIGTPLELFDRPGNLFVAQFIGSPAMNVLQGRLRRDGARSWVEGVGSQWPVGPLANANDGQAVHYGIRPGDIEIGAAGQGIAAKVVVVEPTGAETELLLDVGGTQMIVVLHGRTAAQPDDMVGLNIAADKVHLFDEASGQRID